MIKRDKRVQIMILEDGKYIILKHVLHNKGKTFWGIPGGGIEKGEDMYQAAIREAYEETGLKVELMPFEVETEAHETDPVYDKKVTFLAYPVEGEAKLGYDPEFDEGHVECEIVDLKWHDLDDLTEIDEITKSNIEPIKELLNSPFFTRKAANIVYREKAEKIEYLLIEHGKTKKELMIPQGRKLKKLSLEETIVKKTKEKAGIVSKGKEHLGFFIYRKDERCYRTEVFMSELEDMSTQNENVRWMTLKEIEKSEVKRESKKFIAKAEKLLKGI